MARLFVERTSKHGRRGPFRKPGGTPEKFEREDWRTTTTPPWDRKRKRRAAAKIARRSRKANR